MEHFSVLNVWKCLEGPTPNIGFKINTESNEEAILTIPRLSRHQGRVRTLREDSHLVTGSQLFNGLPSGIQKLTGIIAAQFKVCLDMLLTLIPDEPSIEGLTSEVANIHTAKASNILTDALTSTKTR